jgi:hypothetical protein
VLDVCLVEPRVETALLPAITELATDVRAVAAVVHQVEVVVQRAIDVGGRSREVCVEHEIEPAMLSGPERWRLRAAREIRARNGRTREETAQHGIVQDEDPDGADRSEGGKRPQSALRAVLQAVGERPVRRQYEQRRGADRRRDWGRIRASAASIMMAISVRVIEGLPTVSASSMRSVRRCHPVACERLDGYSHRRVDRETPAAVKRGRPRPCFPWRSRRREVASACAARSPEDRRDESFDPVLDPASSGRWRRCRTTPST